MTELAGKVGFAPPIAEEVLSRKNILEFSCSPRWRSPFR